MALNINAKIKEKIPSDVYSDAIYLKNLVIHLREHKGIKADFQEALKQEGKLPRHVIQKTLEILSKVNRYRRDNSMGEITIPINPSRNITSQDVYINLKRLNEEVIYLLENIGCHHIKELNKKEVFKNKTPNDVYRELWTISNGFDALLGRGFTPSDVFAQSELIVRIIKFLRVNQNVHTDVQKPKLKKEQHPNHALYASIELMSKISKMQKRLWMSAIDIPKVPQKVISPTEVYDSLQTIIAELQRVRRRIGVERYFDVEELTEKKTPSDVVQNLEYAMALIPNFDFDKKLIQYDVNSLVKTPNEVYALSEHILEELYILKEAKGIRVKPKITTQLYGLKPIHVYQKAIESMEKIIRLKIEDGFAPSEVPHSPNKEITPNEVYEIVLRIDNEIALIAKKSKIKNIISWNSVLNKKYYDDKTPSDVYDNLWKISYLLDSILGTEYSPNETYQLAVEIEKNIRNISKYLLKRDVKIDIDIDEDIDNKRPKDVLKKSFELYKSIDRVQKRANSTTTMINIPKDKIITPTSVYNTLRVINATINELRIYFGIEDTTKKVLLEKEKSPTDVYIVIDRANKFLLETFKDDNYEN